MKFSERLFSKEIVFTEDSIFIWNYLGNSSITSYGVFRISKESVTEFTLQHYTINYDKFTGDGDLVKLVEEFKTKPQYTGGTWSKDRVDKDIVIRIVIVGCGFQGIV